MSLESVLVLPAIAALVLGLLATVAVLRDTLVLHEAARVGARVAATTADDTHVVRAVRSATPELSGPRVTIAPSPRTAGDVVSVTVANDTRLGPRVWLLRAQAHARVEPTVGAGADHHPWWRDRPVPAGPRAPFVSDGPLHGPGAP